MQGFGDTILKDYPGITIVDIEDGKGDTLLSAQAAQRILSEHPDVVGFFATQANGGVGIGQTLIDKGLAGKKVIISFDTDKGTLDMIKDGTISATLAQGTWNMGYWSLMTLFHLHQGLSQSNPGNETPSMHPAPPFVDTGVTVVTRSNVEDYYAK
jgi:ribose transport system substrate-binding protein